MKRVVIIGGGFGGLRTAYNLINNFEIVLINSRNYFLFTPLLHEVSVGSINRHNVVEPIREAIRHKNFKFLRTTASKIEFDNKKVFYREGTIKYDYLVIAIGASVNYYNIKGADKYTLCLKTVQDSIQIRNRLLEMMENNALTPVSDNTLCVIGAGPTGVELTGDICDFLAENSHNYPNFRYNIYLIQAIKDILPILSNKSRQSVVIKLKEKGVKILTSTAVTEVKKNLVIMGNKKIQASLIIWSGGTKPNFIETIPKVQNEKGYLTVDSYLRVRDNVFALGDCAYNAENPVPALAQVAVKQAEIVSKNIINLDKGRMLEEFNFRNKGILVSVGNKYAVADLLFFNRTIHLKGIIPWFLKRHIYLMNLIGWKNKIHVGIEWFINLIFPRDTSEI